MTPEEAVLRFLPQIKQAVKNASIKYPRIREDVVFKDSPDLTADRSSLGVAAERVIAFLNSGQLAEWEERAGGDQNELDRYVLQALNYDLVDYVRKVIRDDDRARLEGRYRPNLGSVGDWAEAGSGDLSGYPLLRMVHGEGLTQAEIAEELGIDVRTVRRRIRRERDRFLASVPDELMMAA